jgi:hypothetical protein
VAASAVIPVSFIHILPKTKGEYHTAPKPKKASVEAMMASQLSVAKFISFGFKG